MDRIPITFEHEGKKYNGYLNKVAGAGSSSTYHFMNDEKYYLGRLRYSEYSSGWVFDPTPKTKELEKLAVFFSEVVTAWYE